MTVNEYNKCVSLYADGIYRFIAKNLGDKDRARDIVQDTFEKLWNRVGEIHFDKAKSYLFTTAYNGMIDLIRRSKFSADFEQVNEFDYTSQNDFSDIKEVLHEGLKRLPEIQRSVILLRDYEGYSYDEISEITRLNASQVKVYIYRARVFLKEYIGKIEHVI